MLMQMPKNMGGFSCGGVSLPANEKGQVDVPSYFVQAAKDHGLNEVQLPKKNDDK